MTQSFLNILSLGFIVSKKVSNTVATDLENSLFSFTDLYLEIELLSISELAGYASLILVVVQSCTH